MTNTDGHTCLDLLNVPQRHSILVRVTLTIEMLTIRKYALWFVLIQETSPIPVVNTPTINSTILNTTNTTTIHPPAVRYEMEQYEILLEKVRLVLQDDR